MKKKILFTLTLLFCIPYTYAIDNNAKKKHPYAILTKDYGILDEKDLNDSMKPEPYSPKNLSGHIYWQCYPRDKIKTTLNDMGYSSADLPDNDAALSITVYSKPGISHTYGLRRNWAIPGTEKRFHRWLELMKGEPYVCLAGRNGIPIEGKKEEAYYWTFEKIKTKKGCNSYFEPINCT